jgi:hypothetical protein
MKCQWNELVQVLEKSGLDIFAVSHIIREFLISYCEEGDLDFYLRKECAEEERGNMIKAISQFQFKYKLY